MDVLGLRISLILQYSWSSDDSSSLFTWVFIGVIPPSISPEIEVGWISSLGQQTLVVEFLGIWLEVDRKFVFDSGNSIVIPSICASRFWLNTTVELIYFWICYRSWCSIFIALILSSRFHSEIPWEIFSRSSSNSPSKISLLIAFLTVI